MATSADARPDDQWQIIASARGEEPLAVDEPFTVQFAPADLTR